MILNYCSGAFPVVTRWKSSRRRNLPVVKLAVGPVKARFKGKVRLQDLNPPQTYTIVGEGEGGIAGFAKGNAAITLTDVVEGTDLSYRAQAQIGGKIAQLGQRLVAGAAKKIADLYFSRTSRRRLCRSRGL